MAAKKGRSTGASKKGRNLTKVAPITWRLDCFCKQDKGTEWIATCANCGKWYHGPCIGLPKLVADRAQAIYCKHCEKTYGLKSKFHPKCRLAHCELAAPGDSEYCRPAHCQEYWQQTISMLSSTPVENKQILKWLVKRCAGAPTHSPNVKSNALVFQTATPSSLPSPPRDTSEVPASQLSNLERAVALRNQRGICGFNPTLLDSPDIQEEHMCQTDIKQCGKHKNWPDVLRRRVEVADLTPQERVEPEPAWLAKRAKYLVAGTTRYSRRKGWKAAYFVPYVWEDGNQDYFLDNNPEPFWDKHF